MKNLIPYAILLLIISCKSQSDSSSSESERDSIGFVSSVDSLVKQYQDLDIFSGVILVAEDGKPMYHKAFGMADREKEVHNTLNTLFDIGSMNKTFTSVVVKQLVQEGKLSYDDKLTKYVSGFQDSNAKKITIGHLLNHTSGFRDYHDRSYFDAPPSEKTLNAIVNKAKGMRLLFEPGTGSEYSNTGYVLLGTVIEKATGKSYFDNVQERTIDPLSIEDIHVQNLERHHDGKASGYLKTPLGVLEKNENKQDPPNPDGGFLATAEAIMKFYQSYYNDTVLLSEEMKNDDAGFKEIRAMKPGEAITAAGGFEGFNTALFYIPSEKRTIIVFANMDEPVAEQLGSGILAITRGKIPAAAKLPAIQNVRTAYEQHGTDHVKDNFDDLTTNYHPSDPKDYILNDLGYAYLYGANDIDKAIDILTLNTVLFPKIANTWDSLGEVYLAKGDKAKALECYKEALEIKPGLPSAREAVRKISES